MRARTRWWCQRRRSPRGFAKFLTAVPKIPSGDLKKGLRGSDPLAVLEFGAKKRGSDAKNPEAARQKGCSEIRSPRGFRIRCQKSWQRNRKTPRRRAQKAAKTPDPLAVSASGAKKFNGDPENPEQDAQKGFQKARSARGSQNRARIWSPKSAEAFAKGLPKNGIPSRFRTDRVIFLWAAMVPVGHILVRQNAPAFAETEKNSCPKLTKKAAKKKNN
jgi:hypothetical protein